MTVIRCDLQSPLVFTLLEFLYRRQAETIQLGGVEWGYGSRCVMEGVVTAVGGYSCDRGLGYGVGRRADVAGGTNVIREDLAC